MTELRPGTSPPPVSTPIRFFTMTTPFVGVRECPTTVRSVGTLITSKCTNQFFSSPTVYRGSKARNRPTNCRDGCLSRGGEFRRRRACVFAKPLDDLLHDLARMRSDRDHDRVLVRLRLFQRRELAVE